MILDKERRTALMRLAQRHALLRWTKKQRNAELRCLGFDPDGEDGRTYRWAFRAACAVGAKGLADNP